MADEAGGARQNWELLTLLIDTRINKAEEHRLREGMGAPQKLGIQILKKLRKPMALENMQDVLRRAREGKLHIFSEEQGARNSRHRKRAVASALAIAAATNIIPGLFENFMIWRLGTNGIQDA